MDEIDRGNCIAWFEKNSKDEFRAYISEYRGKPYINIRVFYRDDLGNWKPGKQGITIAVDRYRDLANIVLEIGEHLKKKDNL